VPDQNNSDQKPIRLSHRDPAGWVFRDRGHLFRTVTHEGTDALEIIRTSSFFNQLIEQRRLVPCSEASIDILGDAVSTDDIAAVLRLEPLPFISHPYEWTFSALKRAALFHLDIQIEALEHDITLIDASAYNIQFLGAKPVFIDHLSFRPYERDSLWHGHRQFCEQFLNPLVLQAHLGVPFNDWYRGRIEGIPGTQLAALLPKTAYLNPRMLTHILLPAFFDKRAIQQPNNKPNKNRSNAKLPQNAFKSMLMGLRHWITRLDAKLVHQTAWKAYEAENTYTDSETAMKRQFIAEFIEATKPVELWDLGCNTGAYAALALEHGANHVIGFDADHAVLEAAFQRAEIEGLNFTPLYQNLADPSADQGWNHYERPGLGSRRHANGVLALAVLHHLVIGHNIPLKDAVTWIISCAPNGIIEFAPKSDPMVRAMLLNRPDIFEQYREDAFFEAITSQARIVQSKHLANAGRLLVWYDRD
jgi:ribosomal protein L11 methylase PrmA